MNKIAIYMKPCEGLDTICVGCPFNGGGTVGGIDCDHTNEHLVDCMTYDVNFTLEPQPGQEPMLLDGPVVEGDGT